MIQLIGILFLIMLLANVVRGVQSSRRGEWAPISPEPVQPARNQRPKPRDPAEERSYFGFDERVEDELGH